MDTEQRIEVAKQRLDASRQALIALKEGGPPCTKCRYYQALPSAREERHKWSGPFCTHPSVAAHTYNPVTAKVSEAHRENPASMRAPDGACGPEAVLFELGVFQEETIVDVLGKAGRGLVLFFAAGGVIGFGSFLSALF